MGKITSTDSLAIALRERASHTKTHTILTSDLMCEAADKIDRLTFQGIEELHHEVEELREQLAYFVRWFTTFEPGHRDLRRLDSDVVKRALAANPEGS